MSSLRTAPRAAGGFDVVAAVATVAVAVGATAVVLAAVGPFSGIAGGAALAAFALVGAAVAARFERAFVGAPFGLANTLTLGRAGINCLVLGWLAEPALLAPAWRVGWGWLLVAVVATSLALDGLDGRCARRRGQASSFGARFDVEVDALLLVTLALAAVVLDRAGLWVLALAAPYPLFRSAAWAWPRLRGTLAPSRRRKLAFGLQATALLALLTPVVPAAAAAGLAAVALAVVAASFGRDVHALARRPGRAVQARPIHTGA